MAIRRMQPSHLADWVASRDWVGFSGEPEPGAPDPGPVFVNFSQDADGVVHCTGLLLGPEASRDITGRRLRQIPIQRAIDLFVRENASPDEISKMLFGGAVPESEAAARPGRGEGAARGDDYFRELADEYRAAVVRSRRQGASGRPSPVADLAKAKGFHVVTVRRHLAEARKRGFLAAGLKGKAGEKGDTR